MAATESIGTDVVRLLPRADASTLRRLERAARQQAFSRRDVLHARGCQLPHESVIFDTPHPVAQRADLAAMIGTSRVMMYRTLRGLEADGLVQRQRGGGINVPDEEGLTRLASVAPPDGAPDL